MKLPIFLKMNIPKKMYPHLYEYNKLMREGKELESQLFTSEHERDIEMESYEFYELISHRKVVFGPDEKVHQTGVD